METDQSPTFLVVQELQSCLLPPLWTETNKVSRPKTGPKLETLIESQGNSPRVVVIFWGNSLVFSKKLLPVLAFTGAAPRRVSTSSGKKKSVSQSCPGSTWQEIAGGFQGLRVKSASQLKGLGPLRFEASLR